MPTMAVTHPTTIRNGIADHVVDQLDQGSTNATGQLVLRTAGSAVVATLNFSNPAFGAAASGTATANAIGDDTNTNAGTSTVATLEDSDTTTIINASGGTSGTDIVMSSNVFQAGDTARITSLTYTAPN